MSGSLNDMLETLADAIIESRAQKMIARDAGLSEKHVSQMLTGKVTGTLSAWQRMLDAAGLSVTVIVTAAEPPAPAAERGPARVAGREWGRAVSDLTGFRDYCRKMAGSPVAPGCPAASNRALWLQMADEIDAYLGRPSEAVDLFGEVAVEPPLEDA